MRSHFFYIINDVCFIKNLFVTQTIFPFAFVGYEIGYRQLDAMRLVGYLPSHIQRALVEKLLIKLIGCFGSE